LGKGKEIQYGIENSNTSTTNCASCGRTSGRKKIWFMSGRGCPRSFGEDLDHEMEVKTSVKSYLILTKITHFIRITVLKI
jgi:hypothetical protein